MKEGWLWLSILNTTASPSPMSTTPAFSPGPWITCGPLVGSWLSHTRRGFVGAVLAPHDREDAELGQRGLAAEDLEQPLVFVGREPVLGDDLGGDAGGSFGVHTTALKGWILKRGASL